MQSPILVVKAWELVPGLPISCSTRIWLCQRVQSGERPVLESAQGNAVVLETLVI